MADFRATPGRSPEWHETGGAFSNFEFVDLGYGSHSILRRVFSLARKLKYHGLLVEQIDEADCALLAQENAALAVRLTDFERSRVTRFSFFAGEKRNAPGEFLGYAIFKQDHHRVTGRFSHVYEAVLRSPRGQKANNFVHCGRDYTVNTSLGRFTVRGVLFGQQNDATYVCAHVALRAMIASFSPNADISYAEINKRADVGHALLGKRVGGRGIPAGAESRGLFPDQIETVLRGAGLEPELIVHEPTKPELHAELPVDVEFQRLLYGYLESGSPVLLGFELAPEKPGADPSRHILPVFGHTFNEDLWVPEAERKYFAHNPKYFPSESWLSTYLAHDDNFGPYVCLPRHYLRREQFRLLVGCRPAGVVLPPEEAETRAFDFVARMVDAPLEDAPPWLQRLSAFARAGLLVLRSLAVERSAYRKHLAELRDKDGYDLEPALADRLVERLPPHVWLVEVSAPELYPASRRKFGEVVLNAAPAAGVDPVLIFRMPGRALFRDAAGKLVEEKTRLAGHTAILSLSTD